MKRLQPADYRMDKLFPRVARAIEELLAANSLVSAPAVFVKIGMLSQDHLQAWRAGKVPYLERVIKGSLGKTERIVRIISFYAHDLKLPLAPPDAAGPIKHKGAATALLQDGCTSGRGGVQACVQPASAPLEEDSPARRTTG